MVFGSGHLTTSIFEVKFGHHENIYKSVGVGAVFFYARNIKIFVCES